MPDCLTKFKKIYLEEWLELSSKQDYEDYLKDNILTLIYESRNLKFLAHETTKRILKNKWHFNLPASIYYLNLISYILFVVF